MAKEIKALCKWEKEEYKKDFDKLTQLVIDPSYICKKCGRASNKEEVLCKPKKIK